MVVEAPPAVIKLGAGFDYSRGDYGFTEDTIVTLVPLNLSVDKDRWAFKATVPFITIEGPARRVDETASRLLRTEEEKGSRAGSREP